ncbi:MAG: hypothetical protein H7145_15200 [Akkermansiaceae bacterium]|nr:hypothetical protein [Armatimonadota bacterium]
MMCRQCGRETWGTRHTGFCSHCGALLGLSPPSDEERQDTSSVVAQKRRIRPKSLPVSHGPLLTGHMAVDLALGFLGEIAAFALLAYSIWQFFRSLGQVPEDAGYFFFLLGMFLTSIFLFWHTKAMRRRYPTFAKGWQTGRDTWGKGVDHLLTLIFGVLMLCVLFPLGGLLLYLGFGFGLVAWVFALFVAYLFGMLARRMSSGNRKPGENIP